MAVDIRGKIKIPGIRDLLKMSGYENATIAGARREGNYAIVEFTLPAGKPLVISVLDKFGKYIPLD